MARWSSSMAAPATAVALCRQESSARRRKRGCDQPPGALRSISSSGPSTRRTALGRTAPRRRSQPVLHSAPRSGPVGPRGAAGTARARAAEALTPEAEKRIRALLDAGSDKVSLNAAALRRPELIDELAATFGAQCVVLAIDAKARHDASGWEAYLAGGRTPTGRDAVAWASEGARRGAGEILLTSMDRDGTKQGFDLALTRAVADAVPVPVIASGRRSPLRARKRAPMRSSGRMRSSSWGSIPTTSCFRSFSTACSATSTTFRSSPRLITPRRRSRRWRWWTSASAGW